MRPDFSRVHEEGAALIVCLLMMVVILLLGTSGAQIALQEEKASRHERDRLMAFVASEAALKDAELDISKSSRVLLYTKEAKDLAAGRCESGAANPLLGLCQPAAPGMFPAWQRIHHNPGMISVPLGYFTGRSSALVDSAAPPRYLIEVLPDPAPHLESTDSMARTSFRITSIGYGSNEQTQVVLQSYFRRAADGRWGRLGWREILNWEELREALERE
ncbi:pilus assembly PilX family protein [Noviherbaspirillum sp. ST9]|uniref:pilus assembly PilX family protein n=1 Tax=Noviherbaspirillum sp. ST9 TaxID=3401606 RepID=UPI003B5870B5